MDTVSTVQRMSEQQRAVAKLLAEAGIRSIRDLTQLVRDTDPIFRRINYATVYRYLNEPPDRLNHRLVATMAELLNVTTEEFVAIIDSSDTTKPE